MIRATPGGAGLAAIALLFVLPFLLPFHRYPITSFYSEWLAFALGVCGVFALFRRAAWEPLPLPAMAAVPLAFAVLVLLQSAAGLVPYTEQATVATQYLVWASLLMVLGAVLRDEFGLPRLATVLAWALVAGAVLNSFAGLLQHYVDPARLPLWITPKTGSSIYGNLAQRNHFAGHVMLGLVSLSYLYACGKLRQSATSAIALLFLLVLALAASRSTFLYLAASCLVAAIWHRRGGDPASRRILLFMLLTLPGFVLANGIVTLEILQPRLGTATAAMIRIFDTVGGVAERFQLWGEAWWMFLQSPWFGMGLGAFPYQHFGFHSSLDVLVTRGESFNHAHNIVLHVAAETGLTGVLILIAAAAVLVSGVRRAAPEPATFWLTALLAVLLIFSLLEYPLWYSYFLGVGAVALGALGPAPFSLRVPRIGPAAAVLVLGAGSVMLTSAAVNYRDFEELFFIRGFERPEHADRERFFAIIERLYREPLLVPYVELAAAFASPITPARIGRQRALFDRAVRFAPRGPVVYRRVLVVALAGDSELARRQFAAAYKVYPHDLPEFVTELKELHRAHPAALGPLLELATAKFLDYAASRKPGQ